MTNGSPPQPPPTPGAAPGTSVLFVGSLLAIVVNMLVVVVLRLLVGIPQSQPQPDTYSVAVYVVATIIGIRHLLRVTLLDSYIRNNLLPVDSPELYWMLLVATMLGTISFTISIAGLRWYLLVLIPYLGLFIVFGLRLFFRVISARSEGLDCVVSMLADFLLGFVVWLLYASLETTPNDERSDPVRASLDQGLAFFGIVGILLLQWEGRRVYWKSVAEKLTATATLLCIIGAARHSSTQGPP